MSMTGTAGIRPYEQSTTTSRFSTFVLQRKEAIGKGLRPHAKVSTSSQSTGGWESPSPDSSYATHCPITHPLVPSLSTPAMYEKCLVEMFHAESQIEGNKSIKIQVCHRTSGQNYRNTLTGGQDL